MSESEANEGSVQDQGRGIVTNNRLEKMEDVIPAGELAPTTRLYWPNWPCLRVFRPEKVGKKSLAEIKNGKIVFKQKPISYEKHSETMQGSDNATA